MRRSRQSFDVLFFAPSLGPVAVPQRYPEGSAGGGAETQIWAIAKGLAARGISVGILIRNPPSSPPELVSGVRLITAPGGTSGRLGAYAAHVRTLARLILGLKAKLMVQRAAGPDTALVAAAAAATGRQFVYSSAHVVDFDYGAFEPRSRRVRLFEWGVRRASEIVVQTQEQSELCERRFGRPGRVIRSIAEEAPPRAGDPRAFLWMGRLDSWKNPHAYLDLARSLPDARFQMVVRQSTDPELAEAVRREASAIPNLELLPSRPRDRALELLDEAVAVVSTSDYEGMPNVFLEGWARGIPALALRHDPDSVIARYGLGAFAGGDPGQLTELARTLWARREDQRDVAVRCRDYVLGEHSLKRAVDAWEAMVIAAGTTSGVRP